MLKKYFPQGGKQFQVGDKNGFFGIWQKTNYKIRARIFWCLKMALKFDAVLKVVINPTKIIYSIHKNSNGLFSIKKAILQKFPPKFF